MAALPRVVPLRGGGFLPTVGLGVYRAAPSETEACVTSALELGYRHVDTAQVYGNEAEVGRAVTAFELGYLQRSALKHWRQHQAAPPGVEKEPTEAETQAFFRPVFITTKVWKSAWGYDACLEAVQTSLEKLPHIDLLLLHAPGDAVRRQEAWAALEHCKSEGLVANIGVSNFGIAHLQKLLASCSVPPCVNQLEVHPFLQRRELVQFCQQNDIVVQAYSPLAKAHVLEEPSLVAVAQELKVSTAQVLIRWSLQKGLVPLPKSVRPGRQASNLDVWSFALSAAHMATLDALERNLITGWDPVSQDKV